MSSVIEISQTYYQPNHAVCVNCQIQIHQTMKSPIYFLYQLGNFYQNHRRYIQSKNNFQLAGNSIDSNQASVCAPKVTNRDMNKTKSWGGYDLDPDAIASPCGYIAFTYFNDTFSMNRNGLPVNITETGISWPGDKGYKYKRSPNSSATQWFDPQNQHFIVWMRTSGLPNFKKLWGVIQTDLTPGNYTIDIGYNYISTQWQGSRTFILTTKSNVGGKNYWLPSTFLIVGLLGLGAVIFFWKKMAQFQKLNYD